ncbi:hypothetical protein GCM10010172_04250 [Paractinoplanes ferrugineus]|uniref:DUF1003 domain-containing protein n=1 Tax=Paractinoplanes ferrugineus TaxID=113564 RepID=A0A919MIM2_9ACTN|nr:DUF1003 domain-containing protein [Actinoplanes ferrugineus]GIE13830.1 hypothetical protein Afe05nite_56700 [Actinoplanes ferrugineus]
MQLSSHSVEQHLAAARDAAARRRLLAARIEPRASTRGERAADAVANVLGSWRFLIIQSVVLGGWLVLNVVAVVRHWDPYPFILLNLMLSFQAAYAAPVLLMSANRQAAVDRSQTHNDYLVNQRAEAEVEELTSLMHAQLAGTKEILDRLDRPGPAA